MMSVRALKEQRLGEERKKTACGVVPSEPEGQAMHRLVSPTSSTPAMRNCAL